jgi:hypothetical protein
MIGVLPGSPLHVLLQKPQRRSPSFALCVEAAACFPQLKLRIRTAEEVTQCGVHDPIVASEHPQRLTGNPPVE